VVSASTSAWFLGPGCVTTIAGSGASGAANGPALSASFNNPRGLVLGSAGKIYVADWSNNRIRLIDGGQVSTFAGTGVAGLLNGTASTAQFDLPNDVLIGPVTGNLYVADNGNNVVRTIASGVVSTLAGASTAGFVNGLPSSARFNGPNGLAADGAGRIYISDSGNHAVRMYYAGAVSTVAGTGAAGLVDGAAASAQLNSPFDVAVDSAGAVVVADRGNHRIRKIAGGQVSTVAGSGTVGGFQNGAAASARFNNPVGVAVAASGTIYVGDEVNHRIRAITAGNVTTLAGTGVAGFKDGPVAQAQFDMPGRLAVDSVGLIYVCDPGNQRIRLIRP
jgi:sugar lactone lactonase YvrE